MNKHPAADGARPATIRDVAALAEVSAGTVSNVLNRPFYVNENTRARVLDAIRELDFSPRPSSRQYRPGRIRTLGIAVANLEHPFFVDVALGAEEAAQQLELATIIANSAYDPARENQNLDLLVQQRVQGVIISPVDERSSQLQMLRDRGVPTVFVDRVDPDQNAWSVVVDDRLGGQLAAEHLINKGHQRMTFIGHPDRSPKVQTRLEGALAAAEGAGATLEVLKADSWTIQAGREAGSYLADHNPADRPSAIICANDLVALGALQSLVQRGISVPDDMAIVGYDDIEWAEASIPTLTTIRQPRRLLGGTAVRMLAELLQDPHMQDSDSRRHVVLKPHLVERHST